MKFFILVVIAVLQSACAIVPGYSGSRCDVGVMGDNGFPCWVNRKPAKGIVVSMSEHLDPNKTRDILFKKALLEIAAMTEGVTVSEDSIVKKQTRVSSGDRVSQQAMVVTLATVNTANGSVTVKAKVMDEWKHPMTRKLYLWVVPVD